MGVGYSDKSLSAKLGLTQGTRATVLGAPRALLDFVREEAVGASLEAKPLAGVYQLKPSLFLWCFCNLDAELKRALPALRRCLEDAGTLWISWPKKSSWKTLGLDPAAAVTEDGIRKHALPLGLVDVKVCAVDETWSGLKLTVRRENRK